ncbi:MAG: threonine synthase [Lachnospiraceae bacterium]|jgi:threonine synthase|nr:threonine synthase [Lachnospiraceae bacterium]
MEVKYHSTRSEGESISASEAILKGLADDGGLYVPTAVPALKSSFEELAEMDYRGVACEVMGPMLPDYKAEELKKCVDSAYDDKFDTPDIVPLAEADGAYYIELFHGPTIAFKDMALSILPHLMITAARKNRDDREIVILTATSGDTGKAALAGFADVPGTKIIVFYPKDGVSAIQKRQMVTQKGANTCVIGIDGNFDDAQSGVKKIFTDERIRAELDAHGCRFSSANSINIGRLVPQMAYYVFAYSRLVKEGRIKAGEEINITVPTGNFGNILAAYYAKQAGLPVHKLICASNANKVLFDFFGTGNYDRRRPFILTSSPSMDILVSSNLERLLYAAAADPADGIDTDAAAREKTVASCMARLSKEGVYSVSDELRGRLGCFYGGFASEDDTAEAIRTLYEDTGYVIDPHTAVARHVYGCYRAGTGDTRATLIASTASPFKFGGSVMRALRQPADLPDLELADRLSALANVPVPEAVRCLKDAEVRHTTICSRDGMEAEVRRFLRI